MQVEQGLVLQNTYDYDCSRNGLERKKMVHFK